MDTDTLLSTINSTVPLSPRLEAAFRHVDRAQFVEAYYHQQGTEWLLEPAGSVVYEDKALTTQMRNGLASSSSSQPSVMAMMLEALDVQPGQHVLEVGTGTGYNAALLAELVGPDGYVVTVDIDEELLERANKPLVNAGYASRICIKFRDGREGDKDTAPFDRIILTAGIRAMSPAWIEQLQTGGIIVGNWRGEVASVLFCLRKEGTLVQGKLLARSAFFMDLHSTASYPTIQAPDWARYDALASVQSIEAPDGLFQTLSSQAFLFYLEGQYPGIEFHVRPLGTPDHYEPCKVFLSGEETVMLRQNRTIDVRGVTLWEHIRKAYERYAGDLGSPLLEDYHLTAIVSPEYVDLFAQIKEEFWRF